MLEQLLMVEQSHKQALYKLEDEKRNHGEFMKKSDEFTNLLEQERERSVLLTQDLRRSLGSMGTRVMMTAMLASIPSPTTHTACSIRFHTHCSSESLSAGANESQHY